MAIDPVHPFPFVPNFGFGLILTLRRAQHAEPLYTIIRVPQQTDRFVRLPGDGLHFCRSNRPSTCN